MRCFPLGRNQGWTECNFYEAYSSLCKRWLCSPGVRQDEVREFVDQVDEAIFGDKS